MDEEMLEEGAADYAKNVEEEMAFLLGSPVGRRLARRILFSTCGLMADTFCQDMRLSTYAQGRQSIGIELRREMLTHCPELYLELVKEGINGRDDGLPDAGIS